LVVLVLNRDSMNGGGGQFDLQYSRCGGGSLAPT
jgi:hypothetical protein